MPPLIRPGGAMTAADDVTSQFGGAYAAFYEGVAARQVLDWLPPAPGRVLDLSGADGHYATQLASLGYSVVHLTGGGSKAPNRDDRLVAVEADLHDLGWLRRASFDGVLAESSVLSACLAFEESLTQLHGLLRAGGRLLLSLDSLALGLARLAEQGRWAELADVPTADVVLVPTGDGRATRCFWPQDLTDSLDGAGFETHWIRPRTVLSPEAVNRALRADPGRLETLVETETRLEVEREGDSAAYHLVVSAERR